MESPKNKTSYAMGVNIGMNIKNQLPLQDLDVDDLISGLADAIHGRLKMSEQEIMQGIQAFSTQQKMKEQERAEAAVGEGAAFLEKNAQRAEVTTTESGLQYEVIVKGESGDGVNPKATDAVTVHYHGTLIDGTVFDSSVQRGDPITFNLNQVIRGWTEGVQLMQVGDKFRFTIPSDLAYGENGAGNLIGPNSTLIFDVELLGIN